MEKPAKVSGKVVEIEALSKEQTDFNKKIESIRRLKAELDELSVVLKAAVAEFQNKVHGLHGEFLKLTKERLHILSDFYWNEKLSKGLRNDLLEVLICECENILSTNIEDNTISEMKMEFEAQKSNKALKGTEENERMHDYSEVPDNDERSNFSFEKRDSNSKKHSAKQKAKEEVQKRSIKEVYRDLIKIFHPDMEQDEVAKLEKEEISKKITTAYKKNDLLTLLEVEGSLVLADHSRIKNIAEDKLKIYNEILNDQKLELEANLYRLKSQHEYIYRGMCMKNSNKDRFLKGVSADLRGRNDALINQMFLLNNDKKYFKYFISSYLDEINESSL